MTTETPITYVSKDGRHVVVPYDRTLATLIPHAKPFEWHGVKHLVVPNRPDEARLARNVGVPIPAPILTRYDWCGTTPWDIQRVTAALLTESPRCYVLNELGTGKTRSVLYALDYLMRSGLVTRALVVAPLSTLTPVWESEAFRLFLRRKVAVLHASRDKRLELLATGASLCIINHHGTRVIESALIKAQFDAIIIDELAIFRRKSTELWRSLNRLVNLPTTKYAWGLTGAPTPREKADAWAQIHLLTPSKTTKSYTAFRDLTMQRVSQFRWVAKPGADAVVHAAMQPSVRFTRDDVMELPECLTVDRAVALDQDAHRAYELLYRKARLLTEKGDSISAVNEGVLHNKLLQVSCGFIYTDTKTIYALPANKRLHALESTIDETDRKVIVLVPFLHALAGVSDFLRKQGHDIAVVHGGTPRGARDKVFTDFQTKPTPHIIVAHPQCLAHGLTLTEANTIVWYSPTTSLEIYDQANARINRPGQKHNMLIVHMVGTSVERATYTRLQNRQRMQNCLLHLFKEQALAF